MSVALAASTSPFPLLQGRCRYPRCILTTCICAYLSVAFSATTRDCWRDWLWNPLQPSGCCVAWLPGLLLGCLADPGSMLMRVQVMSSALVRRFAAEQPVAEFAVRASKIDLNQWGGAEDVAIGFALSRMGSPRLVHSVDYSLGSVLGSSLTCELQPELSPPPLRIAPPAPHHYSNHHRHCCCCRPGA